MKTPDGTLYGRALDCSGPRSACTPCVPMDTWHRAPLRGDIVDDAASLPPSAEQLIEAVMAANPTFSSCWL